MKKIILFFWFLFLTQGGEAEEGKCKNPIFLSAFEVDPTILILLDNSSSMNVIMEPTIESGYTYPTEIGSDTYIYNPNTIYSGIFKNEFWCEEDGWYTLGERTPNNWVVAYFVKNDYSKDDPRGWYGAYTFNYLNWLLMKANLGSQPWKEAGGAKFYKVTLKRVNVSKTPEIPRFLEDLTDENGNPLLKEPWKDDDHTDYYWFENPNVFGWDFSWSAWYKYWYKKPASRMNIARYVINDLIRTDWKKLFGLDVKFRYGLMVFRKYNYFPVVYENKNESCVSQVINERSLFIDRGGDLLVECGSISTRDPVDLNHIKRIEDSLRGSVISDRMTPLAESLYEAGMYFIGSTTKFAVAKLDGGIIKRKLIEGPVKYGTQNMGIQSWCQDNSILLITDGFPTYDTEVPPLKGNYTIGDIIPNDEKAIFDYDGDEAEPPKFQEMAMVTPWNTNGVECNKLKEPPEPAESCSDQFCSHYLDDVVKYLGGSSTDLIGGTGIKAGSEGDEKQKINTYIVGFQYDSPFLQESAEADKYINGNYNSTNYLDLKEEDKRYFSATNPTKLKESLSQIIEDIIKRTSSSVAVAVSISTSESRTEDYIVRARFDPKGWRGFFEAFQLPYCSGRNKGLLQPDDKGKLVCKQLPVWEGGARLGTETKTSDDDTSWRNLDTCGRSIYTADTSITPPTKKKIEKDDTWLLNKLNEPTWIGTSSFEYDPDKTNALVSWIRGEYQDESFSPEFLPTKYYYLLDERTEGWRLFDIVYSTPIVLGAPNSWYGTDSSGNKKYYNFAKAKKDRERMTFVGSNLGMIHAFKLTTDCEEKNAQGSCTKYATDHYKSGGWEKWAYIPSNLLPYLRDKAKPRACHFSGVDLGLVKTDIFMKFNTASLEPDNKEWGTVLVGGEREGGSNYFCLNITDNEMLLSSGGTKTILWEYSNKNMLGDSMSAPEIGIVRKNEAKTEVGAHWVAFLTTSTNSTSGIPYIVPLDIATGKMFDVNGDIFENDEIKVVDALKGITATLPLSSACAVDDFTDKRFDDLIDAIYFADVKGRVWKMTVGSSTINLEYDWKPYVIFEATDPGGNPQPISVPISVAFTKDYKTILFFGTGRYEEKEDITSTQTQTFYCLIDKGIKYGSPTINKTTQLNKLEFRGTEPICTTDPTTGEYKFSGIATRTTLKVTDYTPNLGWYINFNLKGCPPPDRSNEDDTYRVSERVTQPPLIYAGMVFFTSFIPTTQPCSAGGLGYVHAVNYRTGEPPPLSKKEVLVGAGKVTVGDKSYYSTSLYLGEGVPSRAVVDPTSDQLFVQMSDKGEIMIIEINPNINPIHILNWGEEGFVEYREQ